MMRRHVSACALLIAGCSTSHGADDDAGRDAGVPTPDGGGICCPIADAEGCYEGPMTTLAGGGWAAGASDCTYMPTAFSGTYFDRVLDAHGCPRLELSTTWMCPDIDAGPPVVCDGLGPAQCAAAGCIPTYDDACCPVCTPGGCADCVDFTYYGCRDFSNACGTFCWRSASWSCSGLAPDCSTANVTDFDSCSIAGCVPAYPSGVGAPDVSTAICVPIHANVCTVSCERLDPPCPDGTVPEGDGSCFTDRCIPAFVCGL